MTLKDIRIIQDREGLSPNEVEWAFILDQFAEPFEQHEVKFREQSRGNYAAYIDSRTLQQRLDKVVGANWETNFRELATRNTLTIPRTETVAQEKHRIDYAKQTADRIHKYNDNLPEGQPPLEAPIVPLPIERNNYGKLKNKSDERYEFQDIYTTGVHCDLLIFGKARSDVGTPANTEPVKSAYSDALKRAAVQWGIGRYLYSLGFFTSQHPQLPEDAIPAEPIDFSGLIRGEKEKIESILKESPDEQAQAELTLVMSRYSPLVSVLQKRRVLMNLKEITTYLTKAGK